MNEPGSRIHRINRGQTEKARDPQPTNGFILRDVDP